nr:MAG TPA: hypothetical protein [Caudoviricetes sp.]
MLFVEVRPYTLVLRLFLIIRLPSVVSSKTLSLIS